MRDHLARLVVVRRGGQAERHRDRQLVEAADHALHAGDVLQGVDLGQQRLERATPWASTRFSSMQAA